MNKWLISKEIKEIKEEQQTLTNKWNSVKAFDQIKTPNLRLAAAQVLMNQRNESTQISEQHDQMWNKIKYGLLIRLFKQFECEKHEWRTFDTKWPENANIIGLRDDNRTIVLEDGKNTVWTVDPVEKELKTAYIGQLLDVKTLCGNDPALELIVCLSLEIAMEIVSEVKRDLKSLYRNNNVLQYNYCLHSFRLGEARLDDESFCVRTPIIMKYIKTATFGD